VLDRLIRGALQQRALVLALAVAVLAWAVGAVRAMPVDVLPDVGRPTVTVLVEAPGRSPEEVESQVVRPLEGALLGTAGVDRVVAQAQPGIAVVRMEFGWDVDVWRARQQTAERLAVLRGSLPPGVVPQLGPVSSIMGEIALLGVVSTDGAVPGPALRTLVDAELRPVLLAIPGISQVVAIGGGVERWEVVLHPEQLAARRVTVEAATEAAGDAAAALGGGFVDRKEREHTVRIVARASDAAAFERTAVRTVDGGVVTLADVATVRRAPAPARGDAGVDGREAVVLSVQKQFGSAAADTLALTEAIHEALDAFAEDAPPGVQARPLFEQADFIEAAVHNVQEALGLGAALVTGLLLLFLMSWRTTVISLVAIPLSLGAALVALRGFGWGLDTMTLGGLAVAVGELVDDAIVDVENVYRRLAENRRAPAPRPVIEVVAAASVEVRSAIVWSTVIVALVLVPILALGGVEGRLFAPLGVAYITSILASMVVSLTVTPALSSWLLGGASHGPARPSPVVRWLQAGEARLLDALLPHPGAVLGGVAALALAALAAMANLEVAFLPPFAESTATVNVLARPGVSLEASRAIGRAAEAAVATVPEVRGVGRRTGRAELDEHAEGLHYTELDVELELSDRPLPVVMASLRAALRDLPGVAVSVGQPVGHRLDHLLSGVQAQIAVRVFGDDLGELRDVAARVADAARATSGVVDVAVEPMVLLPELEIDVDREAALAAGIAPGRLARELEASLGGNAVATVTEGSLARAVVVRLDEAWRDDLEPLRRLPVVLDDGRVVALGDLAEVRLGTGPNQIVREGGARRALVTANVAGRGLGETVADLEAAIEGVARPEGVRVALGGQVAAQQAATRQLAALGALSLMGMIAALWTHLRSGVLVAQVLVNLPLALIGAVVALLMTGRPLSIATWVGLVTLCGIASRNSILMITHYAHLVAEEGWSFGPEMVVRGTIERLVPVLMTALCAGLALFPLALTADAPGKEILGPMAQVVLGGLVSSTLLDLVVTPTLFLRYGERGLAAMLARGEGA
jgi:CzcA family heavy metal efflux pump